MKQAIAIGQSIATKYLDGVDFPKKFVDGRFYFHSTAVFRAKQTQMAFAQGLFGNTSGPVYPEGYEEKTGTPVFDSGLTPIPTVAMLTHNDYMLLGSDLWFFIFIFIVFL